MSYKGTKLGSEAKEKISKANTKPKLKVVCQSCGKRFEVWYSRLKKGTPKYCSAKCYGKALKSKTPWNKGITAIQDSRLATAERHGMYGKRSLRWAGGKFIEDGYVLVWYPDHPENRRGYIKEHRLVIEKHIGRRLEKDEVVHHKNGIKTDNRLENLQLMTKYEHAKYHFRHDGHPRTRISRTRLRVD